MSLNFNTDGIRLIPEKPPIITALDESEGAENIFGGGAEIIGLELDILGEPVHFRMSVVEGQARLADIVPAARVLSNILVQAVLKKLSRDGKFVPCRKGCSACCNYLIPLSVPEVFRLWYEVLSMPPNRGRAIVQSCLEAATKILKYMPENLETNDLTKTNIQIEASRLSRWYSGLELFCPFLSEGLCTIYQQRPMACREHMVTGSALLCEAQSTEESQVIRMPVSIIECLSRLATELEQSDIEVVMLPLALPWVQGNLVRCERKWSAVTMVERFVGIVKEMASTNTTAAPACI
jgi:Fe-S-cluster containining protein